MTLNELTSVSPLDGRYRKQIEELAPFFSEYGLIKYRVLVEIEYFIALCKLPLPQLERVSQTIFPDLRKIYQEFSEADALAVKKIEKITNHDVKAVEYFLRDKFNTLNLSAFSEFIHFGLTSQDINNTATPLLLRDAMKKMAFYYEEVMAEIDLCAEKWHKIPMLARTHGQPASPTRLGKELLVFSERMRVQFSSFLMLSFPAKFGGATGNMNAHVVAFPSVDWHEFARSFVEDTLELKRSYPTTQIEHYDNLAAIFDNLKRINNILIDFGRDMWHYISLHYFKQKIKQGEVGSSAMPHKVNPIDFENAEGNLGLANAIFEHLSAKLPISRLQRDLTDSTVLRNIGVPVAHTLIALKSLMKGIAKIDLNEIELHRDLESNWAVTAEAIQTILRRECFPDPYEVLKGLTRTNEPITKEKIKQFIETLDVSESVKEELRSISPFNYTGLA
ncbi:MAG: adenylosuccinate lyase [Cyclobacteriaceae bacterium]|nr:adenylosuccinate lyase [Cyclobacteriaceae bacterium]